MKKFKKIILSDEEENNLSTMGDRIKNAMGAKGIENHSMLRNMIVDKRGDGPELTVFEKISYPPTGNRYYNLSIAYLIAIADALDVTVDYLLGITNSEGGDL